MTTPSQFSTTLKDFLQEHNITQIKLAETSNINRSQITQYCTNQRRPSLDNIIKMSDALETLTRMKSMKISEETVFLLFNLYLRLLMII